MRMFLGCPWFLLLNVTISGCHGSRNSWEYQKLGKVRENSLLEALEGSWPTNTWILDF